MAWVSCIFTCRYSLSHPFLSTIITHVGGSTRVNRGPMKHWPSSLNNTNPNLIPENPTAHWVQIYSNQKEINYISHSNIRASVETRPPKLSLFCPVSDILWTSPRASRVSAIPVFIIVIIIIIFSLWSCLFCKWSPNSPFGRDNNVIVPVYGQTVHGLETRNCQFIFQLFQGSSTSGMT